MAQNATTKAIVLRTAPYLENHRILTLFSQDLGKLTAVAYGALSVKSKLRSGSALFAGGEYVLASKGEKLSVASFTPDANYFGALPDFDATVHASYLCSLCDAVLQPGQTAPELFAILNEALSYICYGALETVAVFDVYLLQMLDALGYAPELNVCAECGANKGTPKFAREKGGLCCRICAPASPPVSRDALRFLRAARQGEQAEISAEEAVAVRSLLTDYTHYSIEKKLRAADLFFV